MTTFASLIPLVDVADPASQQQQQQEPVQEAEGAEPSTEQEGVTEGDYSTVVATGEGSSESQQVRATIVHRKHVVFFCTAAKTIVRLAGIVAYALCACAHMCVCMLVRRV